MKKIIVHKYKESLLEWCQYFYQYHPVVRGYVEYLYPDGVTKEQLMTLLIPHLNLLTLADIRREEFYKKYESDKRRQYEKESCGKIKKD